MLTAQGQIVREVHAEPHKSVDDEHVLPMCAGPPELRAHPEQLAGLRRQDGGLVKTAPVAPLPEDDARHRSIAQDHDLVMGYEGARSSLFSDRLARPEATAGGAIEANHLAFLGVVDVIPANRQRHL